MAKNGGAYLEPNAWKAEVGGSGVLKSAELHSKTLSGKQTNKLTCLKKKKSNSHVIKTFKEREICS